MLILFSGKNFMNGMPIIQQIDERKELHAIEVKLHLTMLKPLRAQWLTEWYANHSADR